MERANLFISALLCGLVRLVEVAAVPIGGTCAQQKHQFGMGHVTECRRCRCSCCDCLQPHSCIRARCGKWAPVVRPLGQCYCSLATTGPEATATTNAGPTANAPRCTRSRCHMPAGTRTGNIEAVDARAHVANVPTSAFRAIPSVLVAPSGPTRLSTPLLVLHTWRFSSVYVH